MNATDVSLKLFDAMHVYFAGEKFEALVFILPIGLLCLVFGAWLFIDGGGSFARGVAIPILAMGLLMAAVGTGVGFRTPGQVARLEAGLQAAPQATQASELARMTKVNNAWKYYLSLWGLLGAVGLVLRFATQGDFTQGMGIALVLFSGIGLMVDGFAERRTHAYVEALGVALPDSAE